MRAENYRALQSYCTNSVKPVVEVVAPLLAVIPML
jgi:hypothetical protein